jgi:hypothetical protein
MKRTTSKNVISYTPLKFHDLSEECTTSILKVDDYGKQARNKNLYGRPSDTSMNFYKTMWRHFVENSILRKYPCVNLKANYSSSSIISISTRTTSSSSSNKCKKLMLSL